MGRTLFPLDLPFLVLAGIIVFVVTVMRRSSKENQEHGQGISTLHHFFYYGLAFLALFVAISAVSILLSVLLEIIFGRTVPSEQQTLFALGVAMAAASIPVWAFFWHRAQRIVVLFPEERGNQWRNLYFSMMVGLTAFASSISLLVLGNGEVAGIWIAVPLVNYGMGLPLESGPRR